MARNKGKEDGECPLSIEKKIKDAIEPLGYSVYPNNYDGDDETYFVFNHNTVPGDFGNNVPQHERALIQVHLFCPHTFNSVTLRKNIKKNLSDAGFSWPYMTNASEKDNQHYTFECEDAEGVTDG